MKYTVKWVKDNLGITKKMIRIYEEGGALPKDMGRNPMNNYREYSAEDIYKVWSVKLLRGLRYTVEEIANIVKNPKTDFYEVISGKVVELEKEYEDKKKLYEFAKTIKLTGSVPSPRWMGQMKYDDFIEYAKEHWNFYLDERGALTADVVERIADKAVQDWTLEDYKSLDNLAATYGEEDVTHQYNINAYYRLLVELKELEPSNEAVQKVVRLLYEYQLNNIAGEEGRKRMTPSIYARRTAPLFLDGDIAKVQELIWGKEGCLFIAKAIAIFGGEEVI